MGFYEYVHVRAREFAHVHARVHVFVYVHAHAHALVHAHAYAHVHMYVDVHAYVGVCARVLANTSVCVYVHVDWGCNPQFAGRPGDRSPQPQPPSADRRRDAMKAESKIQLALAVVGVPFIFWIWKPDSKWPNPFALGKPRGPAPER